MVLPWTRLVDLIAQALHACTEGERVEVETMVRVGVGIKGRRWLSGELFGRLVWTSLRASKAQLRLRVSPNFLTTGSMAG